MRHDRLTIVSVYGHNSGASAIPSIVHSMQQLPGSRGLLLSIEKPNNLPDSVAWKPICALDYKLYSVFMMHCLYSFIETDYCLVVQDDGWVLDGSRWKEEYYEYDYLGAPSHCGVVQDQLALHFTWYGKAGYRCVQNGGFSLRSRRFCEAPNRHGLAHRDSNDIHGWNEDAQLSMWLRPAFESWGYKYASDEVARDFAIEYVAPGFHQGFDFRRLVGHHGQSRKLVAPMTVRVLLDSKQVVNTYGERSFLDFLQSIGYTLELSHDHEQDGTQAADAPVPAGQT